MGDSTRLSMVEGKDDKAVRYEISETGIGSQMIVKGVNCPIDSSDTDKEEGSNLLRHIQSTLRLIH
jgi:hypothetical protein